VIKKKKSLESQREKTPKNLPEQKLYPIILYLDPLFVRIFINELQNPLVPLKSHNDKLAIQERIFSLYK